MVDINNHIEVAAISDSCQILSDTLNLVEKHIRPGQSVMELDKIAENYIISCDAKPCLLYTSPSPRDRTRSRMPSSA